jgi:hypothetical protein
LGVLPHAEGHGHHRRASARARTGLPGSLRGAAAQRTCHRWPVAVLWLGYAMLCRAIANGGGEGGSQRNHIRTQQPHPRQRMPAHLRAELRTVISSIAIVGVENGLPQRNGAPRSASSATRNALQRAGREGASNPRKLPARCRCRCPLPLPAAAAAARGGGRVFPLSRWEGREPGWDGGARRSALGLRAHRGGGWPHAWAPCGSGRPWGHWSAGEQSRAGCVIFA